MPIEKVDTPVVAGELLDLTPYCVPEDGSDVPPLRYKLVGMVLHNGESLEGSHYTATVRNAKTGRWLYCDDDYVPFREPVKSVTTASSDSYILFYTLYRWGHAACSSE